VFNADSFALTVVIINAENSALTRANPRPAPPAASKPRRRTGGRSARVLDAVARAVLEELNASGMEGFSIPQVAIRAGVSNSSLYRRWPNKAALISFAGSRNSQETIPFPDCGSLRKDLAQALAEVLETFSDPSMRAVIAMAFSTSDAPELKQTLDTFWKLRVEQQRAMFDRAIARGEIAADVDTTKIIERAVGPLYFRYFVTRRPITKKYLQELVDAALPPRPMASL
jgi:AcrR family transcriptional regulator